MGSGGTFDVKERGGTHSSCSRIDKHRAAEVFRFIVAYLHRERPCQPLAKIPVMAIS